MVMTSFWGTTMGTDTTEDKNRSLPVARLFTRVLSVCGAACPSWSGWYDGDPPMCRVTQQRIPSLKAQTRFPGFCPLQTAQVIDVQGIETGGSCT